MVEAKSSNDNPIPTRVKTAPDESSPFPPTGFAAALVVIGLTTVVGKLAFGGDQLADVVMIYLLGIVIVSLRWGLVPSLAAAILSVFALDFFFIPPFHTFAVREMSHVATFAVMFIVAVVISGLTKRVRDQERAVREREAQAQQAQFLIEAEQLRNSLLSSVSHDLRTPLAIITGAASTLRNAPNLEPVVQKDLTETILSEAETLNRLVRNLLDMTRLEAGAVEVKKEWQSIEEAVGAALDRSSRALGEHRPIVTNLPADLPLVPYDSILLQQVLVNLLENAAKYTPPDAEVSISARSVEGDGGRGIEVEVSDRGPGLPKGEESKIFGKFYRAEKGRGGGVGLGLTICKGIITAHGGRLWAQTRSDAPGGASFHFTLPIVGSPPSIDEAERNEVVERVAS